MIFPIWLLNKKSLTTSLQWWKWGCRGWRRSAARSPPRATQMHVTVLARTKAVSRRSAVFNQCFSFKHIPLFCPQASSSHARLHDGKGNLNLVENFHGSCRWGDNQPRQSHAANRRMTTSWGDLQRLLVPYLRVLFSRLE